MIHKYCFLLLALLYSFTGFAQTKFTIAAEIQSHTTDKVSDGEAYLYHSESDQLFKTALIVDGKFHFPPVEEGTYKLHINCYGFETMDQEIILNENQNLKLTAINIIQSLEELVIQSERKTFTNLNGNIKVDIANAAFKSASGALDLLSQLPGIQISADKENISVIGKGNALIYIDNQKAGVNELNALSVEDIRLVEIVKNPSVKYEAEGRAVILIKRKINYKNGVAVNVSEIFSLRKKWNNDLGWNVSFKKDKTEVKVNLNYKRLNPWEGLSNHFEIPQEGIRLNYSIQSFTKRLQLIPGAGIYHQINDEDYLSFNVSGRYQKDADENTTTTQMQQGIINDNIATLNHNDDQKQFLNSYINYHKKLSKLNALLFTGVQYAGFNQQSNSVVQNNYNNSGFYPAQNRDQDFKVSVFSARADLEKILKHDVKWETGLYYLYANANTDFSITNLANNETDHSEYQLKEQNSAAYTQISGVWNKITYNVGLRAENTNIKGKYKGDDFLLVDKNYTSFFPKVQIGIPLDSAKSFSLNYAKSITRPNYSTTSQGAVYINPFVLFARNINLRPTMTQEVAAGFQYKDKSVKLNFYKSKDPVNFGFSYDNNQHLITFNTINYDQESGVNLEFTIPLTYKTWSSVNVFNFVLNKVSDQSASFSTPQPYLYFYTNQTLKLPKELTCSVTAWGLTERNEGVFQRNGLFTMNLALNKTFFKVVDTTLNFNDIFKTMNFTENFNINDIASRGVYYNDWSEISLSLRYKFGNIKNSGFKQRNIDENLNRI